jgi:hypothetical protein
VGEALMMFFKRRINEASCSGISRSTSECFLPAINSRSESKWEVSMTVFDRINEDNKYAYRPGSAQHRIRLEISGPSIGLFFMSVPSNALKGCEEVSDQ